MKEAMRIYLSRSIYDDPKKIQKIIRELEEEGNLVHDGVKVYEELGGDTGKLLEFIEKRSDLVIFIPTFTPGVRAEYEYVKKIGKPYKISRRIVR